MTVPDGEGPDGLGSVDFVRQFRDLPPIRQRQFVADLWAASGWTTTIDGSVVTAVREEGSAEVRRIDVRGPNKESLSPEVDMVVVNSETKALSQAIELTPEDLYRRARYGLDRETADQLVKAYFDRPIGSDPSESDQARDEKRATIPLPLSHSGASASTLAVGGVIGVIVAILIITAAVSGGLVSIELGDRDRSSIPVPPDTSDTRTKQDQYTDLRPTCNRPPNVVVGIQLWALKYNDPETNDGIQSVWRFISPTNKRTWGSYSEFVSDMYRRPYSILLNHERTIVGPVRRTGSEIGRDESLEEVSQIVIASSLSGNTSAFEFTLTKQENSEYPECWMIASLSPLPVNRTNAEFPLIY